MPKRLASLTLRVTLGRQSGAVQLISYAQIHEIRRHRPAALPLRHPDWVFSARISPDGRYVLSARRDHMAWLCDWRHGELVCPPLQHKDKVFGVDYSPTGRFLFTSSRDGTVRVWEWMTGKPVTPPLTLWGHVYQVSVTPDGDYAVAAGQTGSLCVFRLDFLQQPEFGQTDVEGERSRLS